MNVYVATVDLCDGDGPELCSVAVSPEKVVEDLQKTFLSHSIPPLPLWLTYNSHNEWTLRAGDVYFNIQEIELIQ